MPFLVNDGCSEGRQAAGEARTGGTGTCCGPGGFKLGSTDTSGSENGSFRLKIRDRITMGSQSDLFFFSQNHKSFHLNDSLTEGNEAKE